MSNLNAQQQKNFEMGNQAAMKALSEAARKWREKQAAKALVKSKDNKQEQDAPPLVTLTTPDGIVFTPRMKPDGKGGWTWENPTYVNKMMGWNKTDSTAQG